jgi:hypothetical protein
MRERGDLMKGFLGAVCFKLACLTRKSDGLLANKAFSMKMLRVSHSLAVA